MLPPTPNVVDFNVIFPLLRLLQFPSDLKSTILLSLHYNLLLNVLLFMSNKVTCYFICFFFSVVNEFEVNTIFLSLYVWI